ncbi:hypothetical protein RhiirA4_462483 [Rhizophagus irregularis]|uniref:Uncharacterized protein n=1 Tax=Rhizophagus irregularis TaxID=588596 RepID=A0A2I1GL12_9GLOM|nr:hypothetical protein RhiirA4_462483 [Rhizophagus irregularis]
MAFMEPTNDINFSDLVKKIHGCIADMSIDKARIKAGYLIALEFVARVFYLILLKKLVMDLSPQQYLLAQINGGQMCIADIKYSLASYEFEIDDLESIFRISSRYLEEQLGGQPIFSIDKANIAITKYFFGDFRNLNGKPCGLLTPMVVFLFDQRASIVISGTSFSLEQKESVLSDVSKGVINEYLDEFGSFTIENIESYLRSLLELSECDLKSIEEFKCLIGHPCFASRLVVEIIRVENKYGENKSKQDVFKEAIKATIKAVDERLKSTLEKFIEVANDDISRYELDDRSRKLIDSGIAHLAENNNKSLVIDEPLAVDVVKTATNISDTSKGCTWQYLAQSKLMSFNGRTVANFVHTIYDDDIFEIGGIRKTNLPEWTNKAIINIKSYGDLEKLSWQLHDKFGKFKDDVMFIEMLLENPKNREYMLDPNIIMRPDGVYIGNNIDHSDDYWTLLISAKFYGSLLSGKGVSNDKRTTEWRYVYYEDGEDENTDQCEFLKNDAICTV